MLKSTALASTVTLADVTGVARTIAAAIVYLVLTRLIEGAVAPAEARLNRHLEPAT